MSQHTERGLDRLTYFTDAIAAIAITLLILPLVDRVGEARAAGATPAEFLGDNASSLAGFVLSFVVIARLWVTHHWIFEHVAQYNSVLRWLSIAWAFTIVLLPLPTAIVAQWPTEPFVVFFYIGTMTLSSIALTGMVVYVRRHPVLENGDNPVDVTEVRQSILTTAEFVIALIVGTLVPQINYFALFALFLSIPINAVGRARAARQRRSCA